MFYVQYAMCFTLEMRISCIKNLYSCLSCQKEIVCVIVFCHDHLMAKYLFQKHMENILVEESVVI